MVILTIKYMTPEPIGTIMGKCRGSPTYINSPEDLAKKIILSILNNSSFSLAKLLITGKQFQLALTFPMQPPGGAHYPLHPAPACRRPVQHLRPHRRQPAPARRCQP